MDSKFLGKLFENLEVSQVKKDKTYFEYFSSISSLSIALIGLLIGLKPNPIPNEFAKIAFLISIILIGLCIIFSLGTRFYEIVFYGKEVEVRKLHIKKYLDNPSENEFQEAIIEKPKLYVFFEIATFICLVFSILSLISYVYLLEFKIVCI